MPLQTRRPELPFITVPEPDFDSVDPRTPLPFTPMPYEQCHPMMITPTQAYFESEVLGTPMSGMKRSRPLASPQVCPLENPVDATPRLEWDAREDSIVQSFLSHPLHPLSSPYPPSTLPPPGALDELASQIMHYHRAPHSSLSSSTSLPQLNAIASGPSSDKPKTRPRAATTAGWKHSWAATRQRLFELARKESKEAIGGVSKRARGQKPEISRNNSMAFLDTPDDEVEQPGIGEVLRLSTSLQRSSNGTSGGLAGQSLNGLSSPLSFSPVPSRRGSINNGAVTPNTQPKSLLSRGRSFTADDFESYIATNLRTSPVSDKKLRLSPTMSFTPCRDAQEDQEDATPAITLTVHSPSPIAASRSRKPIIERGTPSRSPSPSPAFSSLSLGSPKRCPQPLTLVPAQPEKKRQRMLNVAVPPATGWTDAGLRSPFEEGPARRITF